MDEIKSVFDVPDLTKAECEIRNELERLRLEFERSAGVLLKRFADGRGIDVPIVYPVVAVSRPDV